MVMVLSSINRAFRLYLKRAGVDAFDWRWRVTDCALFAGDFSAYAEALIMKESLKKRVSATSREILFIILCPRYFISLCCQVAYCCFRIFKITY